MLQSSLQRPHIHPFIHRWVAAAMQRLPAPSRAISDKCLSQGHNNRFSMKLNLNCQPFLLLDNLFDSTSCHSRFSDLRGPVIENIWTLDLVIPSWFYSRWWKWLQTPGWLGLSPLVPGCDITTGPVFDIWVSRGTLSIVVPNKSSSRRRRDFTSVWDDWQEKHVTQRTKRENKQREIACVTFN